MDKTKNYLSFVDTVLSLKSQRFTKKSNAYCGKTYWIAKCKEREFKIIEDCLEDKSFLKLVENNSIVGRTYTFAIMLRGKYLVRAELFEE